MFVVEQISWIRRILSTISAQRGILVLQKVRAGAVQNVAKLALSRDDFGHCRCCASIWPGTTCPPRFVVGLPALAFKRLKVGAYDRLHRDACVPEQIPQQPPEDVSFWLIDTHQQCIVPGLTAQLQTYSHVGGHTTQI